MSLWQCLNIDFFQMYPLKTTKWVFPWSKFLKSVKNYYISFHLGYSRAQMHQTVWSNWTILLFDQTVWCIWDKRIFRKKSKRRKKYSLMEFDEVCSRTNFSSNKFCPMRPSLQVWRIWVEFHQTICICHSVECITHT